MILDVGCFDGGFLDSLGSRYERHGIEINEQASQEAQRKGVDIIGTDFSDLEKLSGSYDGGHGIGCDRTRSRSFPVSRAAGTGDSSRGDGDHLHGQHRCPVLASDGESLFILHHRRAYLFHQRKMVPSGGPASRTSSVSHREIFSWESHTPKARFRTRKKPVLPVFSAGGGLAS